jgi:hypothetical protein
MFEYDKHYRECKEQNKPFIKTKVNPKHGNYYVQIDLMTCNYELSIQEQEEIKKLVKNQVKFIQSDFQDYNINKELAWFDGISHEHVDEFCKSLYDLTQKYH